MPQHCKKRVVYWIISQKVIQTMANYCCKQISFLEQMSCLPCTNLLILSSLSLCTYLLRTHLSADWHPLKYLWGVRSLLRPSQGEQLLPGHENSLSPSDRHRGICSHDPLDGGMCTISRPTQHTCPGSFLIVVILLWPPSGPPNLVAYIITEPSYIYHMKTFSLQLKIRLLYPCVNHICRYESSS